MAYNIESLKHAELDDFVRVWWKSFEPEAVDQVLPMLYPQGLTPELVTRLRNRLINDTSGDTVEFCFTAKDPETNQIVGVSWWTPPNKPSSQDDAAAEKELDALLKAKNASPSIEGMNLPLGDAFYSALYNAERGSIKRKGVPYIGLNVLAVLPEYARRGVGSLLLEDGLKRADSLNLWTFLVAASTGKGLYEKHDFEVVDNLPFDARKYGGRSEGKHWIMVRKPQK